MGSALARAQPRSLHVLQTMALQGVDLVLDVHGDEAIPHVFVAGFHGIPSLTDEMMTLYKQYLSILQARTEDFQTAHGYPDNPPGAANLTISTNQLAERFGAIAMTLEMPFKDHDDVPNPIEGWSPARSQALGRDCVLALSEMIDALVARRGVSLDPFRDA